MSIDDKVDQAVNRMTDFYLQEDLEMFYCFVEKNNLPFYKSFLFLDGQTRADYWITFGRTRPCIHKYMNRAKKYFNGGN